MANALIGATGLVGSNLLRQARFDDLFHSRNIDEIAGRHYDLLVCAGAPGQKWLANQWPADDRAAIDRLIRALAQVRAERVVLISTVDVFPVPVHVDEESPIDALGQQPYGRHRHELEQFMADRFASLIVRLPGLFGAGLKKNIIYDFLHDHHLQAIHAESSYQFYGLDNLWRDIQTAHRAGLRLVHLATESLLVQDLAREAFDRDFTHRPPTKPARYDFRSRSAALFGGTDGYLYSRRQILLELRRFVHEQRSRQDASGDLQPGLVA